MTSEIADRFAQSLRAIAKASPSPSVATYARSVTSASRVPLRDRLYETYVSQHAGCSDSGAARLIYRRDIRPLLPSPQVEPVVDIGCGRGEMVGLLLEDGYDASGIDVSPEQAALARAAGLTQVREGDYREFLAAPDAHLAAVTATDVLEHLDKNEVLETFDLIAQALVPGGVFIARVPNAASSFGGRIQYGDFTHESSFTARSARQLAAAAGFSDVVVMSFPPVAHGLISAGRAALWQVISGMHKLARAPRQARSMVTSLPRT